MSSNWNYLTDLPNTATTKLFMASGVDIRTHTEHWEIFEEQNFRGLIIMKFFVNRENGHLNREQLRVCTLIFEA